MAKKLTLPAGQEPAIDQMPAAGQEPAIDGATAAPPHGTLQELAEALADGGAIDSDQAPAAELQLSRMRIQVIAPKGQRRRAGLSFGPEPVDLTFADLGATLEEASERFKLLAADPQLAVKPVIDEAPAS